jgi:uncharacterized protein YlxW (UPF0749 family)
MNTVINKKIAALSVEHPAESFVLKSCAVSLAVVLCAYAYLVAATALNVIASKEASTRATALEGQVGSLQQRYFDLSQSISSESIAALGLSPVVDTVYVYRPSTVGLAGSADHAN